MTVPVTGPAASPLETLLAEWLPLRRWYPAKGRAVAVRVVADLPLPYPAGAADGLDVSILVVDLHAGDRDSGPGPDADEHPVHLQVPVVRRRPGSEGPTVPDAPGVLIGTLAAPGGPVRLYDGTHDPAYAAAVVALLANPAAMRSASGWIRGHPGPAAPATAATWPRARVLRGEQSNTSVIIEPEGGPPLIVKVFRALQAGDNPDVVLQSALAAAGSRRVAPPAGHLRGGWVGHDGREIAADLAFASRFLPASPDAWRTATAALAEGAPFDTEARELGEVTAEVHRTLAAALPSQPATPVRLARLADSLAARVRWATSAVPELADVAAAATDVVHRVRLLVRAPDWQRIHGDLHLGQVLRPPGRGWVLLDFEGEPLRPLSERVALDTPVRDVAGMLRSFDYAAGRAAAGTGEAAAAARAWAVAARDAFCDGYAAAAGDDPRGHAVLLRALELEKALYEVVYETRNRPDWVGVPLAAVRRLLP